MKINWNEYAKHYDNLNHLIAYRELVKQIVKNTKRYLVKPSRILDVGCGTGSVSYELHKEFSDVIIHGIDSSHEMIKLAKSKFNSNKVQISNVDITELEHQDKYHNYDLIVLNNVLYTIKDKSKLLKVLGGFLNEKGIIIFSDPVQPQDYKYMQLLVMQNRTIKSLLKTIQLIPSLIYILKINKQIDKHYYRFSKSDYDMLLNELNFNILNYEKSYSGQANLYVINTNNV